MKQAMVFVCIVKDKTNEPSNVMGPMPVSQAERVARGASINLNHAEWHIVTLDEDKLPEAWKEKAE